MLRIALAQINPTVGDLPCNRGKIVEYIARARAGGADIVIFPELAVCGYPPEDLLLKEHFVRDNIKSLNLLAREVKGIAAVIGFVDIDKDKRLFNAAAVISDGRVKGIYHKKELPNYGVFDEKRYFTAGDDDIVFSLGGHVCGVTICEDIWVDGSVYQKQVKRGAGLLINISSSPYDVGKLKKRRELLRKRAREAKAFICYANLVGGQDELVFDGGSMVIDPRGKVFAFGKPFEEDLVIADVPVKSGKKTSKTVVLSRGVFHETSTPLAAQVAPEGTDLQRIYKALVLGARDYVLKNQFRDCLIGLSGGIDSSLVAAIAVDAIGKENVTGVSMPSRFTSAGTRGDARRLAQNLGIKFQEVPIEKMFEAYLAQLQEIFGEQAFGLAEENLQARIRGTILMTLSNRRGSLVLTTGNKSEVGVGYCTLYGDMSGGFAVIKDVPKTTVYDLARMVNAKAATGEELIPQSVIDRPPTAELKENQKDQDSLPPYPDLDKMLKEYVEEHRSLAYMARKNDKELVKKVIAMVDRNEYKRRQGPPGIKITPRAFGKDWRLPITNKYRES
ncbi:MAG TPA: NAD+ synthase [Candidatus Omnitrophica bacterium]|nr:NAD+ synthase [Candidatus Omnitrophota bacterium]HCI44739.1 NAD+ synthase [Candidatus Omnitrophota bacterium]